MRRRSLTLPVLATATAVALLSACGHAMTMIHGADAATAVGLGPRTAAEGRYVATLATARPPGPTPSELRQREAFLRPLSGPFERGGPATASPTS